MKQLGQAARLEVENSGILDECRTRAQSDFQDMTARANSSIAVQFPCPEYDTLPNPHTP